MTALERRYVLEQAPCEKYKCQGPSKTYGIRISRSAMQASTFLSSKVIVKYPGGEGQCATG